ncbi:hypothetical protein DL93DRAFT_2174682 [Clavulina sp. PMI_390]|nr:hypothetical protein DL93DRAFT_2174682 [Clavulina sp. PMI_390]
MKIAPWVAHFSPGTIKIVNAPERSQHPNGLPKANSSTRNKTKQKKTYQYSESRISVGSSIHRLYSDTTTTPSSHRPARRVYV